MDTLDIILYVCIHYYETSCIFLLTAAFLLFPLKREAALSHFSVITFMIIVDVLLIVKVGNGLFPTFLAILLFSVLFKLYFHVRFYSSFLATILSVCLYSQIANLYSLPFASLPDNTQENYRIGYMALSLTFFTVLIIRNVLPLHRLLAYLERAHFHLQLTVLNSFLCLLLLTVFWKTHFDQYWQNIIVLEITTLILFTVNLEIILSHRSLSEHQRELSCYAAYMPIVEELIQNIRTVQHNHNNMIQAISALPVTHKDYQSLKESLAQYTTELTNAVLPSRLLSLNYKLVSGLLYHKFCLAKRQNKTLHINIRNDIPASSVTEYELVEYLGILLDNALEATPEHGALFCTLGYQNNHMFIETLNPGPHLNDAILKNLFKKGYSSKGTSTESSTAPKISSRDALSSDTAGIVYTKDRGIGLWSLKNSLKKHHGTITVSNQKRNDLLYIRFLIEIPIPQNIS